MMKNFLTLLAFSLLSTDAIAQRYDFDYFVQYNMTLAHSSHSFYEIHNTQDSDYQMRFHALEDGSVRANLLHNNVIHTFEVSNIDFPLKQSDFKYLFSKKTSESKDSRKFRLVGMKDLENNQREYSVSAPLTDCKILALPHEMDASYSGLAHTFDGVPKGVPQELFKDEKLIVLSSKCKFKDGMEQDVKLQSFQPLNFTLVLPAQLKFNP